MKKIQTKAFLGKLEADTREILLQTKRLHQLDPGILCTQPAPGKWSVAQVLEHLNTYGRYYLPLMESLMRNTQTTPTEYFKPGFLGAFFTRSMLPKKGEVKNKMKTMKGHSPQPDIDSHRVITEFTEQQHRLLEILERASLADLQKVRVPITLTRLIKLQLGDTLSFLIAHHQRHFVQIENHLEMIGRKIPASSYA